MFMSRIKLVIILVALSLISSHARAQENPVYSSGLTDRKDRQIYAFLQEQELFSDVEPIELAKIDLNADALAEYIARPSRPACRKMVFCPYAIVAFKNKSPILLNRIEAKNLMISAKKTYGIRDLIVYTDPRNDFRAQTFSWNPFSFRFEPEKP